MAKNFPYFKFTVSEWMTGDIVFEDLATQGLFINICALYWQRDGKLSIDDINKRYKNPSQLANLTDRFFSVNDGLIDVKFLDEQLIDAGHISKVNSENGRLGGRPRKENKPTAKRPLSDRKAKKSKEEKEKEEELNISFNSFWSLYPNKVARTKCEPKWEKLTDEVREIIMKTLPAFIQNKPFESYTHPNPETYLNQKRWEDQIPETTKTETMTVKEMLAENRRKSEEYHAKTDIHNIQR